VAGIRLAKGDLRQTSWGQTPWVPLWFTVFGDRQGTTSYHYPQEEGLPFLASVVIIHSKHNRGARTTTTLLFLEWAPASQSTPLETTGIQRARKSAQGPNTPPRLYFCSLLSTHASLSHHDLQVFTTIQCYQSRGLTAETGSKKMSGKHCCDVEVLQRRGGEM